jgi:hypothetical protein
MDINNFNEGAGIAQRISNAIRLTGPQIPMDQASFDEPS